MKTIALKIKMHGTNANVTNNGNVKRHILNIMLLSLGMLAFCYIFLLGSIVFNIIERRTFEVDARALSNEVMNLELQYLSMSNKIDLTLAKSMGFQETKTKFAVRKTLGRSSTGEPLGSIKLAKNEL